MVWEVPVPFIHPMTPKLIVVLLLFCLWLVVRLSSHPLLPAPFSTLLSPLSTLHPPPSLRHMSTAALGAVAAVVLSKFISAVCSRSRASKTINTSVSQKEKQADQLSGGRSGGAARTEIDNVEKPNRCGSVALNRCDVSASDAVTRPPAALLPSDVFVLPDVFTAKESAGWAGSLAGQPSVFYW